MEPSQGRPIRARMELLQPLGRFTFIGLHSLYCSHELTARTSLQGNGIKVGDVNLFLMLITLVGVNLNYTIKRSYAETWSRCASCIVNRLCQALNDSIKGAKVGSIQGIDVVWVSTLAEKHRSIYVGQDGKERILFIQAEDCTLLAG